MLSQKAINDFKIIYKREFGEEISDQEAQIKGEKLLRLFKLIYKPIPKEWKKMPRSKDYKNRKKP